MGTDSPDKLNNEPASDKITVSNENKPVLSEEEQRERAHRIMDILTGGRGYHDEQVDDDDEIDYLWYRNCARF